MTPLQSRLTRLSNTIDAISEGVGRVVAWLIPLMVLIIGYDVTMRYLFRIGSVALQELEWHLFAIVFLLGAAYTLKHDGHVRVDIFYRSRRVSERQRAWIDIFGTLFFLIPFCVLIIVSAWPFVMNSFAMGEGSPDAGGLPYRYLLKAAIPVGFALLLLQGISNMLRAVLVLLKRVEKEPPVKQTGERQ
jgi:TRAP-type mannitol/chloroaromatic compound transport system permease small subunit